MGNEIAILNQIEKTEKSKAEAGLFGEGKWKVSEWKVFLNVGNLNSHYFTLL